jgi:NADH-ubiquinone oxidoreductase chain 4L
MLLEIMIGYRIGIILFLIGILGFILNRKNIIILIICIEMILLAISLIMILSSIFLDDLIGINFSLYLLAIAGSEAAIGLAILVLFHKIRGSIKIG